MSVHMPIMRGLLGRALRPIITDDRRTYKGIELLLGATHIASLLDRKGAGKVVAIMLPSSGAFPICSLGVWGSGRIVLPLNFFLSRDEIEFVLRDAGVDTILTVKPMLEYLGWTPKVRNFIDLEEVNFKSFPDARWPKGASEQELAALIYSGGTTGTPKGVELTHANIHANIRQVADSYNFRKGETMLGVLPQFHVFGFTCLTWMPLALDMKLCYLSRFQPQKVLRAMRRHRPTFFVGIPSMFNALLKSKDAKPEDFTSFRALLSGGEPLPRSVAEEFEDRFGVSISEGYGLTETSPVTHVNRGKLSRAGSVGQPVVDVHQRICDIESGEDVPVGAEGEIRVKGPNVFRGYYNKPDATRAAFDDQGYFRTGDIGRIDEDGYLWITGRLKEMLIVAGENVFPREIEEVINTHPLINASGVVGVQSDTRGELPVAFVEICPNADPAEFDERELRGYIRDRLAPYKVPKSITVLEELPRSPTGKILRRRLKPLTDEQSAVPNPPSPVERTSV